MISIWGPRANGPWAHGPIGPGPMGPVLGPWARSWPYFSFKGPLTGISRGWVYCTYLQNPSLASLWREQYVLLLEGEGKVSMPGAKAGC